MGAGVIYIWPSISRLSLTGAVWHVIKWFLETMLLFSLLLHIDRTPYVRKPEGCNRKRNLQQKIMHGQPALHQQSKSSTLHVLSMQVVGWIPFYRLVPTAYSKSWVVSQAQEQIASDSQVSILREYLKSTRKSIWNGSYSNSQRKSQTQKNDFAFIGLNTPKNSRKKIGEKTHSNHSKTAESTPCKSEIYTAATSHSAQHSSKRERELTNIPEQTTHLDFTSN